MKPTVPEKGTVIRLEGDSAEIMLEGGKSCKGCGAAKIGLCRAGGGSMFLTVRNGLQAGVGDQVIVGIDSRTRLTGYLLAYIIPLAGFLAGAGCGNIIGRYTGVAALDIIAAFTSLAAASFFSFRRLRSLDRTSSMEVKRIVSDGKFDDRPVSDEERLYCKSSGTC